MFETSLLFKTFFVFGSQLSLVFGICYLFIFLVRKATLNGESFFGANFEIKYNDKGEIDLFAAEQEEYDNWRREINIELSEAFENRFKEGRDYLSEKKEITKRIAEKEKEMINPLNQIMQFLVWVWLISLLTCAVISATDYSIFIKMLILTITSISFGPILAVTMLNMDENDGLRILKLTVFLTFLAGIIGMYSGIDFSSLGLVLIGPLGVLIIWNIAGIFKNFTRWSRRIMGIFGSFVFIGFLLFDFHRLMKASEYGINDWETAFTIGFSIYLDVINLLLELLEAFG